MASTSFSSLVLGGTSLEAFLREHWHRRRPFFSELSDDTTEELTAAFCDGDVSAIIAECRKPDNTSYSMEERDEMERDLDAHGKTLNLPYCFTEGAQMLHAAAVDALGSLANDIEVGVYLSNAGGDVAEWHCDNNHNFTIQLAGAKEWHTLPGGDGRADGARGMFDAPRNAAEQVQAARQMPPLGEAECYRLEAGSVLYLPPGDWHRVVPVVGGSLSVDIRIGHLDAAKWLCESLYASLSRHHVLGGGGGGGGDGVVGALPATPGASRPPQVELLELLRSAASPDKRISWLADASNTRVPRPFPYEASVSDGLHRCASLEFLERRGFLAANAPLPHALVTIPSMIALTLRRCGGGRLLVQLLSSSTLTTFEYCRFGIFCEGELQKPMEELLNAPEQCAAVSVLLGRTTKPKRLLVLLRCLLHANILNTHVEMPPPKAQSPGPASGSKRPRGSGGGGASR